MSRDVFRVKPISPERAVFAPLPGEPRAVPAWLKDGRKPGPGKAEAEPQRPHSNPPPSLRGGRPPSYRPAQSHLGTSAAVDPFYEERRKTESLAAEMRESWRAPGPAAPDTRAVEEALEELAQRLVELDQERKNVRSALEAELMPLVRAVVERVLEREIRSDDGLALRLIREGLSALDESAEVSVTLGPGFSQDATLLEAVLEDSGTRARVMLDHSLPPFTCNVATPLGSVDESLEARLDNVMRELDPEVGGP